MPVLTGWRGAGFGNEVFPWAKAYIGARELGLHPLHPAWGLNRRRYWDDFDTSRLNWPAQRLMSMCLPHVDLTWEMVRETGEDDYALAMRALRHRLLTSARRPVVVRHASGMKGGFLAIRRARDFIMREVLKPPQVVDELYRNFGDSRFADAVRVGVHLRAGDFTDVRWGPLPGEFNRVVPVEWYVAVCRALRENFSPRVMFRLFTDDPRHPSIRRLVRDLGPCAVVTPRQSFLPDLAAMTTCDLLVCSVSSFPMLAAFLSGRPNVWYGPHLGDVHGWKALWACDRSQRVGTTARHASEADTEAGVSLLTRGVAAYADGVLPDWLIDHLETQRLLRQQRHDLLLYGVVPSPASLTDDGASRR